ncbi:glucose 1-dehydrogenase [Actinomadura vinacea]|uniref:Glucose 1-dehydrogenase n=1 Tax=Actinomadura vinacea TaxID=115336 RepID=A0ABN3K579_9ACTN
MSGRMDGRVAIVTGGASGIGAASVRRFLDEGATVVIADVQEEPGRALAAELGERASYAHCDVSTEDSVAGLVDTAVERHGRLDVMFANAGIMGALGPIAKSRIEDVDATFAVNLRGVLLSMKHAARVMQPRRSGCILATSSPAGVMGGVGPHAYSAAKAGVIGLVQSVAAELRPHGIRVNAIIPGAILSAMTADLVAGDPGDLAGASTKLTSSPLVGRPGAPEDVAAAAAFLACDDAAFVTGSTFRIDAGYTCAPGESPFAAGQWSEPVGVYEAGRRG